MRLSDLGEFGFIDRIRRQVSRRRWPGVVGIGDDAAVLPVRSSKVLATTDMLIEGIHFDLRTTDLRSLGWKAAAVNLSDIAAMGGRPRYCLTALGIPSTLAVERMEAFYRGLNDCLRRHGSRLVGGDTCSSRQGLTVAVTMLGEVAGTVAVTRGGARPGDRIFVTGTLGDSAAGLELLQKTGREARKRSMTGNAIRKLVQRHLLPAPRSEWGRRLAASGCASAMIDVSDGLSSDLAHLCKESGVGAEIVSGRVPLSPELRTWASLAKKEGMEYALNGGEDYELLFTVPEGRIARFRSLRIPAAEIGAATRNGGLYLVDESGCKRMMRAAGFDHFRGRSG